MTRHNGLSTRRLNIGTVYVVALLRKELGQRIKKARVAAGLTQRELAELIYIKNASDVSRYERGVIEVPSHRIDLIADATKRPRSFFVRDSSEPEPTPDRFDEVLDALAAMNARLDQLIAAVESRGR